MLITKRPMTDWGHFNWLSFQNLTSIDRLTVIKPRYTFDLNLQLRLPGFKAT